MLADARANVGGVPAGRGRREGSGRRRPHGGGRRCPGAIVLEAEKYKKGTADKTDIGYGEGIGIILSYDPTHTRAEYAVTVPKAGEYELELRYAALESRPVRVSVEGKVVAAGGGEGDDRRLEPGAPGVEARRDASALHEGKNTIAIEAHGLLAAHRQAGGAAGWSPMRPRLVQAGRARAHRPRWHDSAS